MAFGADISETLSNVGNRATAYGYGKADEIRKQYTGYEHDDESGLDFAQARYYNATHGRFTSIDPLTASANVKDPQTFNRYTYALNSPYKFTDPLGLISSSTNACGRWCSNSGDWVDGSAFRGKDDSMGFNLRTQSQSPPPPPPSITMTVNGVTYVGELASSSSSEDGNTSGLKYNYNWWTYEEGKPDNKVAVSADVDKVLDQGLSAITSNIMKAMSAVNSLGDHPTDSTSVTYAVSIEGGVDIGGAGKPVGGNAGVSVGVQYTTTTGSKDVILRGLKSANDEISISMTNRLEGLSSEVPGQGNVNLGKLNLLEVMRI